MRFPVALFHILKRWTEILRTLRLYDIISLVKVLSRYARFVRFSVRVNGFLIYGTIDHWSYLYSLKTMDGEKFRVLLFREALEKGGVVLDCGAYIGRFTLEAASRVGPTGKVYSFEPDKINYHYLLRNIRANGLHLTVITVNKAVADGCYRGMLYTSSWPRCAGSIFAPFHSRTQPVDIIALDDYLDNDVRVQVIKMDIEGAEVHALRGMQRIISNSPRVIMIVECNPPKLEAAGSSARELFAILASYGFTINAIDEQKRFLIPLKQPIDSFKGFLYCVRDSQEQFDVYKKGCSI